jgi:nucleoside-diphosphate-sugar epimerase
VKIVVIGGTGLIGSKLVATLRAKGHDVVRRRGRQREGHSLLKHYGSMTG